MGRVGMATLHRDFASRPSAESAGASRDANGRTVRHLNVVFAHRRASHRSGVVGWRRALIRIRGGVIGMARQPMKQADRGESGEAQQCRLVTKHSVAVTEQPFPNPVVGNTVAKGAMQDPQRVVHEVKGDARNQAARPDAHHPQDHPHQRGVEDLLGNHVNDAKRQAGKNDRQSDLAPTTEAAEQETPEGDLFTNRRSSSQCQEQEPERHGIAGYVYGPASTYHVFFETDLDRVRQARSRHDLHTTDAAQLKGMPSRLIAQYQLRMRSDGVDNMSSTGGVTCAAHTPDDIDRVTAVFEQTVIALRDDGLIYSFNDCHA